MGVQRCILPMQAMQFGQDYKYKLYTWAKFHQDIKWKVIWLFAHMIRVGK